MYIKKEISIGDHDFHRKLDEIISCGEGDEFFAEKLKELFERIEELQIIHKRIRE